MMQIYSIVHYLIVFMVFFHYKDRINLDGTSIKASSFEFAFLNDNGDYLFMTCNLIIYKTNGSQ